MLGAAWCRDTRRARPASGAGSSSLVNGKHGEPAASCWHCHARDLANGRFLWFPAVVFLPAPVSVCIRQKRALAEGFGWRMPGNGSVPRLLKLTFFSWWCQAHRGGLASIKPFPHCGCSHKLGFIIWGWIIAEKCLPCHTLVVVPRS